MTPQKILVIGIVPSLLWCVSRCLARAGNPPLVLGWHPLTPLMFTPDCKSYIRWKNVAWRPEDNELDAGLLNQVEEICNQQGIDLVVPADYDATVLLSRFASERSIPSAQLPSPKLIRDLHNKWILAKILAELNLPFPESEYVDSAEKLAKTQLPFPIITKPLAKWASVGFQIHPSREVLEARIASQGIESEYPLIAQRFIPGSDIGVSFLAKEGRLVANSVFEHKRDGQRRYFRSERFCSIVATLLAHTGYSGVGHFDARYDPEADDFRILELNPRFWASLLYVMNAGVNYPDLLVRIEEWNGKTLHLPREEEIVLPKYEQTMTLLTRRMASLSEKVKPLWHHPPQASTYYSPTNL